MTDYWLSKMFFDLQSPAAAAEFRADREKVLNRYPIADEVRTRVLANDVAYLAKRTNPYLLRYFFFAVGMKDEEFIRKLRHG
jgi:Aromatic-ring-opening dioxygenase LigAB, LigA subunit